MSILAPLLCLLLLFAAPLGTTANQMSAYANQNKPIFAMPPGHETLPNPILPVPQTPFYHRWPLTINKIQETGISCYSSQHCPAQSVCYLNQCYCPIGYMFINGSRQCWRKKCDPYLSDCPHYFENSECVSNEPSYTPENSGHCVCLYSYMPNSQGLSCQNLYQITPPEIWRMVLGQLMLMIFLPVLGGIIVLLVLAYILYILLRECQRRRAFCELDQTAEKHQEEKADAESALDERDDDGAATSRSFELEPMNREPRRPESIKSSTGSLHRAHISTVATPMQTKVMKYFKSSGRDMSPV